MAVSLPGFGEGRVGSFHRSRFEEDPTPALLEAGEGEAQFTGTVFIPLKTNFWMRFPSWTSVT
jgi:hypothetical protein